MMKLKLKDILYLFIGQEVEIYHKGQLVGNHQELEVDHWVYKEVVRSIDFVDNIVVIDTVSR